MHIVDIFYLHYYPFLLLIFVFPEGRYRKPMKLAMTEIERYENEILTGQATASNGQNDLQDGFGQTPLHP